MKIKSPLTLLFLAAASLTSQGQSTLIWTASIDDDTHIMNGTGGGPNANFVQENAVINPLPGSPNSTPVNQGADNDYYFAGVYLTTLPGVTAFYGPYSPVGVVPANENSAERAFAAGDLDLRYHFNLAASVLPTDLLSVTFDALNLDTDNGTPDPADDPTDPRHGVEVYINGVLVQSQIIIREAQLDQDFTTPLFSVADVGAVVGPGADNVVSLRGINYNNQGGGNWMGIDYVQLNSQPVPEPSSAGMILCGVLAVAPFLRRRRG